MIGAGLIESWQHAVCVLVLALTVLGILAWLEKRR
jgi:hypothetical protein